ncbi:2-phospho-L-lactate transferase [Methanobrevibacter sp.]
MITVLSGGTGTPKLLQGLKEIINPSELAVIVNTLENDFFSGVYVSADIDTVLYTMSDMINEEVWYGVKGDTFITNERLAEIGCPELLRIGDIDRATKIQKTQLMQKYGLLKAVEIQAKKMGVESRIIPMSEEHSDIKIITDIGELEFHDFLIRHQSQPEVLDVKFSEVAPTSGIIELIKNSDAVIIGPSNPVTSISPILSLEGVREALKDTHVIAVSPIIGSDSVSGPASKFMKALGIDVSSVGVASLYDDFLDVMVIDNKDEDKNVEVNQIINKVIVTNTIMNNLDAKINLAKIIIDSIPNIEEAVIQ